MTTTVFSVRLDQEDLGAIQEIAREESIDKSTAVRELVEKGLLYVAIVKYKEGRISLGKAAEIAQVSLSEMIDILTDMGIESRLDVADYLEGAKVGKVLFR